MKILVEQLQTQIMLKARCRENDGSAHKRKAACGCHKRPPSLGRKRPRRAAIAGALPHALAKLIAITAQLNLGNRRPSKGVTERYEGLWRSSLRPMLRL